MPPSPRLKKLLGQLPAKPGVYLYRDAAGHVLYVGKAIRLRSRVRSYFRPGATLEPAKRIMVGKIADLEYIVVDSEVEALLLEATLIKRHRPPYNVIFRDDKFYQYIRVTLRDAWPRVETVRRIAKDGGRYFGPYTSGYAVKQTLRLLKRIFPYKSCSEPPSRPCFDASLGRCLGHDLGPGSHERYLATVRQLIRFLEGDVTQVVRQLKTDMQAAARRREFELAARLRDRIRAIEQLTAEQKVISTRHEYQDVIGLARLADLTCVHLFQIRSGVLINRLSFLLQHTELQSDADILASFITQYYPQSTDHPRTVVTRLLPSGAPTIGRSLQLRLAAPSRGPKRRLVKLAELNATDELIRRQREWLSKEARAKLGLGEVERALSLAERPKRIECYDISNVQGSNAVGSMVVFEHGQPKRSDYRKFTIRDVAGSNDFAMLQEVLRRRFAHHRQADGWPDPDLIIIDGGKGQLNAGLAILRELQVTVPTVALAKREEEIFRPAQKESIRLPKDSEGLFLLQRIRDEAHRFAIGTYRRKHERETTKSLLDEIPGIGPARKKKLLQTFGSVEGIRRADNRAIESVIGKQKTAVLRQHL